MNYTLKQLSEIFEFEIIGDENYSINQVSSIDSASEENLVFISDKKFLKNLEKTNSKVVITTKEFSKFCKDNVIIHNNPYLLFVKISHLINSNKVFDYGIHESVVSKTSNLKKKYQ